MKALSEAAKMRVEVARDVIEQLKRKFYVPRRGIYCDLSVSDDGLRKGRQLQDELVKAEACYVCGIGSVFVSLVRLHDNFKVSADMEWRHEPNTHHMRRLVRKYFSRRQMGLIETAFEGSNAMARNLGGRCPAHYMDDSPVVNAALLFHDKYFWVGDSTEPRPDQVLLRIMENIIKNKGLFVPNEFRITPKKGQQ